MPRTAFLDRRPGRQTFKIHMKNLDAVAHALDMSPTMVADVRARTFRRQNDTRETRLALESVMGADGRVFFILDRHPVDGQVSVAVRATDAYDERLMRFESALEVKKLCCDDVPGLPAAYPGCLTWVESGQSVPSATGGPCCSCGPAHVSFACIGRVWEGPRCHRAEEVSSLLCIVELHICLQERAAHRVSRRLFAPGVSPEKWRPCWSDDSGASGHGWGCASGHGWGWCLDHGGVDTFPK